MSSEIWLGWKRGSSDYMYCGVLRTMASDQDDKQDFIRAPIQCSISTLSLRSKLPVLSRIISHYMERAVYEMLCSCTPDKHS